MSVEMAGDMWGQGHVGADLRVCPFVTPRHTPPHPAAPRRISPYPAASRRTPPHPAAPLPPIAHPKFENIIKFHRDDMSVEKKSQP
jgi:hypothetical protein